MGRTWSSGHRSCWSFSAASSRNWHCRNWKNSVRPVLSSPVVINPGNLCQTLAQHELAVPKHGQRRADSMVERRGKYVKTGDLEKWTDPNDCYVFCISGDYSWLHLPRVMWFCFKSELIGSSWVWSGCGGVAGHFKPFVQANGPTDAVESHTGDIQVQFLSATWETTKMDPAPSFANSASIYVGNISWNDIEKRWSHHSIGSMDGHPSNVEQLVQHAACLCEVTETMWCPSAG